MTILVTASADVVGFGLVAGCSTGMADVCNLRCKDMVVTNNRACCRFLERCDKCNVLYKIMIITNSQEG